MSGCGQGRRAAGCPRAAAGAGAAGSPGGTGVRGVPGRCRSVVASPAPVGGGSSIVNASVAAAELSLSVYRIIICAIPRGTDPPSFVLDLRRYQGHLDPPHWWDPLRLQQCRVLPHNTPSSFGSC